MKVVETKTALRQQLAEARSKGSEIALVPTMGALHAGHLSLIDQAREVIGEDGVVVVTIFVNPTQFGPNEDLDAYPRPLTTDLEACAQHGVNLVFAPGDANEIYQPDASIGVTETSLSLGLCGGSRPGHFDGVCLVVAKLFNLIQPEVAIFGEKDYQQLAVIRRMVRDLDFPIKIVAGKTVREDDGLAMSSRNTYLSPEERDQAPIIYQAISQVSEQIHSQNPALTSPSAAKQQIEEIILTGSQNQAKIDYIEIVDPQTLTPLDKFPAPQHRIIIAVFFGKTRLIDNCGVDHNDSDPTEDDHEAADTSIEIEVSFTSGIRLWYYLNQSEDIESDSNDFFCQFADQLVEIVTGKNVFDPTGDEIIKDLSPTYQEIDEVTIWTTDWLADKPKETVYSLSQGNLSKLSIFDFSEQVFKEIESLYQQA